MKILAVETSSEACSAALSVDNDCRCLFEHAPRRHTELILPMLESLLHEAGISVAGLDAIAFGQGPGAFTGVRVAMGVTQGLAFAHDIPVIPVSSLAALAQQFSQHPSVAVALDARMQEVYWGLFEKNENNLMRAVSDEQVCAPDKITAPGRGDWFAAGPGWAAYPDQLTAQCKRPLTGMDETALPSAKEIITLAMPEYQAGNLIPVEAARPVYLRDKTVF